MKRIMVQIRNVLAKKVERARMSEPVFPQNLSGCVGNWKRQGAVRWVKPQSLSIDNIPSRPCHTSVIHIFLRVRGLPHKLGAQVGDADSDRVTVRVPTAVTLRVRVADGSLMRHNRVAGS